MLSYSASAFAAWLIFAPLPSIAEPPTLYAWFFLAFCGIRCFFLAARFALCALLSAVLTYLAIAAGFNYAKVVPAAGIVLGLYAIVLLIATICGVRLLFHT